MNVIVVVGAGSCSYFFGCNGYSIEDFSVSSPYSIVSISPSNLPYSEPQGNSNTWAITVHAPTSEGHYSLSGVVAVSYF